MSTSASANKDGASTLPTSSHTKQSFLQSKHIAWIVLVVGLMITATATLYMKSSVERIAEREFTSQCKEIQHKITERLDDHARILQSGAALFRASDVVTREKWRIFTQHQKVENQLPGIQGIGFSLLIPRESLSRHVLEIRSKGFPEYKLKPDGDREVYSSIIYLEPLSGRNLRAFGYDMFSEPVRRKAMERARDTDTAALSGKIVLVQETDKDVQAGTLMYVPVYHKGMPIETVEERRAAIYGWVYSPYRMNDLMQGIFGGDNQEKEKQINLQVFDGVELSPQSLLYKSLSAGDKNLWPDKHFIRQIPVDFNGQRWTLRVEQTGGGFSSVTYMGIWLTMVGGILITFLLFSLIRSLLNTRAEAQRIAEDLTEALRHAYNNMDVRVQERTSELAQANLFLQSEIADRKEAEGTLKTTRDYLESLIRYANAPIIVWDTQRRILRFNQAFERLTGYVAEEVVSCELHILFPESSCDASLKEIARTLSGEYWESVEIPILRKDGDIRLTLWNSANIYADNNETIIATIAQGQDITDRKRAEEILLHENIFIEALFESIPGMLYVYDDQGTHIKHNKKHEEMTGYSAEELSHLNPLSWYDDKEDIARVEAAINDVFTTGYGEIDVPMRIKNGEKLLMHFTGSRLIMGGKKYFIGVGIDITDQKRAEEEIKASIREKETLLKEIHHRVKNNLQIISSLLSLQSGYIEDEKMEGIFRECQDRIMAMASVHALLYKSQNFAEINFGEYVRETASQLFQSYKTSNAAISLAVHAENVMLPIHTAIPCGLIINELITNALKYAFPGLGKGEIKVEMNRTENGVILLFEDNGIGLPAEVDFYKTETLGLKLVHLLVKQLDGSIEQDTNNGTRYVIMFKTETPQEK